MAKRDSVEWTISQLETLLAQRQARLKTVTAEREKVQSILASLNAEIAALSGSTASSSSSAGPVPGRRRGRPPGSLNKSTIAATAGNASSGSQKRPRNTMSLVATLSKVLSDGGQPMSVSDIVDGVKASGYKSSSPKFRAIVNQTLIKEREHFTQAGRGIYQLKK